MNEELIDDNIERYVLNKMSPEELNIFEAELKLHPDWMEKIRLHELMISSLSSEKRLFKNVAYSSKLVPIKNTYTRSRYLKIMFFILSFIFAVFLIYKIIYSSQPKFQQEKVKDKIHYVDSLNMNLDFKVILDSTNQISQLNSKLYELYAYRNINEFNKDMITLRYIDTTNINLIIIEKAIDAYAQNNFRTAINYTIQISESDNYFLTAKKVYALSLFKLKRFTDAKDQFNILLNNPDINNDEIEWNILMVSLANYTFDKEQFNFLSAKILKNKSHSYNNSIKSLMLLYPELFK